MHGLALDDLDEFSPKKDGSCQSFPAASANPTPRVSVILPGKMGHHRPTACQPAEGPGAASEL